MVLRLNIGLYVHILSSLRAKRSELARELPVAVKGCTIVGEKTRHKSKTKRFCTVVHRRKNVCFHPLNRSPKVAARPDPALTLLQRLYL